MTDRQYFLLINSTLLIQREHSLILKLDYVKHTLWPESYTIYSDLQIEKKRLVLPLNSRKKKKNIQVGGSLSICSNILVPGPVKNKKNNWGDLVKTTGFSLLLEGKNL